MKLKDAFTRMTITGCIHDKFIKRGRHKSDCAGTSYERRFSVADENCRYTNKSSIKVTSRKQLVLDEIAKINFL